MLGWIYWVLKSTKFVSNPMQICFIQNRKFVSRNRLNCNINKMFYPKICLQANSFYINNMRARKLIGGNFVWLIKCFSISSMLCWFSNHDTFFSQIYLLCPGEFYPKCSFNSQDIPPNSYAAALGKQILYQCEMKSWNDLLELLSTQSKISWDGLSMKVKAVWNAT